MTTQAKILSALRNINRPLTDAQLAGVLNLPAPSVRRTRLHLQAAGAIVAEGDGFIIRAPWYMPNVYTGKQAL